MYTKSIFRMNSMAAKLTRFFGSRRFFYVVLGFFIFEALWFVFSAVYPMAFDEDFHLGVIRIYAHQWSPFLLVHPDGSDRFGAVMRDPSYLYHYMMSFPYRLVALFTQSQTIQVITLRILNVAMCAYGVVLFRLVMLRAKASRAFTHVALAIFTLIPIAPQLAAHINYDNLLMVLFPLLCLTTLALVDGFKERRVSMKALFGLVIVSIYISIVKYAALPFVVAAILFALFMGYRYFRGGHYKLLWQTAKKSFSAIRLPLKIALIGAALVGSVLFLQRYAVNIIEYKTPVPDCAQVLTVQQCISYGPWNRDYTLEQVKPIDFAANPISYMHEWLEGMWLRLFFAVNGASSDYATYLPLPVPSKTAIVVVVLGACTTVLWWRRIFRGNTTLIFFALLAVIYCVILWFDDYGMYKQTAEPVAINGRYLLPILPLIAVIMGRGLQLALRRLPSAKPYVACVAIALFMYGGGVFTFILRSDASWDWPNQAVVNVNNAARNVLSPVTIKGQKTPE